MSVSSLRAVRDEIEPYHLALLEARDDVRTLLTAATLERDTLRAHAYQVALSTIETRLDAAVRSAS